MRYFIEIAFNGSAYHGWQLQPDAITVQEVLEQALSTLLREECKLTGAGRTDAGVHARQLFAHFDLEQSLDMDTLPFRLNAFLPHDIAVKRIFEVIPEAHARFDASEREYQYIITLQKDPFLADFAYQLHHQPDVDLMNQAANLLFQYKDFQCFSRSKTDVKTYHCEIKMAIWELRKGRLVFTITADRFLRNMVRAIVGTLLEVGYGKRSLAGFKKLLEYKDRTKAGPSAPAHGLYLTKVTYPNTIYI